MQGINTARVVGSIPLHVENTSVRLGINASKKRQIFHIHLEAGDAAVN